MNEEEIVQQIVEYYNQMLPPQYKIQQHITKMLKAKKEKAPMKYFNWRKLSSMIKLNQEITKIDIGLKEDWEATHCTIYKNNQWIHTREGDYYVQSIWDTPIIRWYTSPSDYKEIICMTNVMQCNEETYEGNNEMFLNWHNNRGNNTK